MALYRVPEIICFRCPLYGRGIECDKAQLNASTIQTHGICRKIEHDTHRRRQLFGDPQVAADTLIAETRRNAERGGTECQI